MTRNVTTKLILIILSVMMLITSLLLPYADTSSANELPVAQGEWNDLTGDRVGKNLFDFDNFFSQPVIVTRGSADVDYLLKEILVTSTSYDAYVDNIPKNPNTKYFSCKANNQYALSFKTDNSNDKIAMIAFFDNNKVVLSKAYLSLVNVSIRVFTSLPNSAFITIRFGVTNANESIKYSNIMLNEGTTALPYEPYLNNIPDFQYAYNGTTQSQSLYYYNYITLKKWIDTYMSIFYHGESTIKVWSDVAKSSLLYTCTNATKNIDYKFTSNVFIEVTHKSLTEVGDFDGLLGLADILFGGLFSVVNLSLKVLFNDIRLFTIPIGFYFMAVILIGILFSIMNKFKGGD